jgi:hypothetical protein
MNCGVRGGSSPSLFYRKCSEVYKFAVLFKHLRARGSVVGWGTMLQAGRSRVRVPMRWIFFFNLPIPSSRTMALGSTQPLGIFVERKEQPARKAWQPYRHLWADCLDNVGSSTSHNPMGLHSLLQGELYSSICLRRSGLRSEIGTCDFRNMNHLTANYSQGCGLARAVQGGVLPVRLKTPV